MSKVNPEPNIIHIMGCYVLGNPNGEKVGACGMSAGPREARVTLGALNLPLLLGGKVLLCCPVGAVSGRTTLWIAGQGRKD